MIDMHAHILWGVDDGPRTMDESKEVVQRAVEEGIEHLICTHHALHPQFMNSQEDIEMKFKLLVNWIQLHDLPITLHLGSEIRLHENIMEALGTKNAYPLGDTTTLLLELPSSTVPYFTKQVVQDLIQQGYRIIIAHPERNAVFAKHPEKLQELIEIGCYSQVTAGSLSGAFGKKIQKISLMLLDKGLIHCYGSDVHNLDTRTYEFDLGLTFLEHKNREELVEYLLENNARVLSGEDFQVIEHKEPVLNRFLSKWKNN